MTTKITVKKLATPEFSNSVAGQQFLKATKQKQILPNTLTSYSFLKKAKNSL